MKKINTLTFILATLFLVQACKPAKVVNSWKADGSIVDLFKTKNVLVIGRTANNQGRIAFEMEIANALRAKGIKATESYTKAPQIHPELEMSEERVAFIKSLMDSEGYNAVVLTVIKDKKQTVTQSTNGIYMGMGYGGYPGYYGGFYDYYMQPYAYGSYYGSFGGYIPTSTSTSVSTDYILETVAYNLDEPADKQLVAVVTTSLGDPNDAHKAAEKLIPKIMESLED
ncbi:hypothetical protein JJL45_15740 [Tamlana sp. s12]|uniref:hypothetical protein n=1 Tax=Tamlana sp. s12 TaxID=1630406 RepID=UPI0007FC9062|nr:hypothetical protein [Tamlana sp. s12]OBQ52234.1 hypothetical protein VQ01_14245 [Tamlana sp. s12]QQY82347.1 hypothetical protein JJL45_15740 [Tamlana sp. s12]